MRAAQTPVSQMPNYSKIDFEDILPQGPFLAVGMKTKSNLCTELFSNCVYTQQPLLDLAYQTVIIFAFFEFPAPVHQINKNAAKSCCPTPKQTIRRCTQKKC